jgi:hypothetical protein
MMFQGVDPMFKPPAHRGIRLVHLGFAVVTASEPFQDMGGGGRETATDAPSSRAKQFCAAPAASGRGKSGHFP